YSRISSNFIMHLPIAYINSMHSQCSLLQYTIGKTPGRKACIKHYKTVYVYLKRIKRMGELKARPAYIQRFVEITDNNCSRISCSTGLSFHLPIYCYFSLHNPALNLAATVLRKSFYYNLI